MAIQYVRTMTINYGNKLENVEFNKLSGALSQKGIYLNDTFSAVNTANYGLIPSEKNTRVYGIIINDETQFTVDYRTDAELIVQGLKNIHPDIEFNTVKTTTTLSQWAEPEGHNLCFTISLNGEVQNFNNWGENHISYENGAKMRVHLDNDYNGIVLRFSVVWDCDTVQRKEAIEDAMVQTVLNDMGKIQKIVESRLKLKKFGYDVENVDIDCHFDAKTESRSECTPDIIKQVREARRGNQ